MEPSPSPRRPQTLIVAGLGLGQTLSFGSSFYLLGVIGEGIARDLALRPALVSSLLSVALLASALSAPAIGRWIDARGGKVVLLAASVAFGAGLGLIAAAQGLVTLCLGVAVLGVAMALGLYETPYAILVGLYGDQARRPMTGIALLGGLGSTVGLPTTLALEHAFGWRGACLAWACVHLCVCLPLTAFLVPRVRGRHHSDPPRAAIPWDRTMVQLAVLFAGAWFVSACVAALLPRVLQGFGLTHAQAVGAASLVGVAAVSMRLAEFTVLRRLPPIVTTRIATLFHPLGAAGLLIFGAAAAPLMALGQGAGNGVLTVAKGVLPLSLYGPANFGYRSALLATPARFAQVGGPLLYGLMADRSAALAVSASSAVCLVMFAMTFGLARTAKTTEEPVAA
ncbi:MAG TPA: MFS transporter [Phenylobacterium sp.]|jgi:predicted MFS family arabinose efflux permease